MRNAEYYINRYELERHPEGGYFKEVFRSDEDLTAESLPRRYQDKRCLFTSIYFLLEKEDFSAFHKLKSDEIWNFYDGSSLFLHFLNDDGSVVSKVLGLNEEKDEEPQVLVKRNTWFAAEVIDKSSFTLLGCIVVPGFEYDDFQLGTKEELRKFSDNKLIQRLTR